MVKKSRITTGIERTALGRHALCLTVSIRVGPIAKVAPVTLQASAFQRKPSARARRSSRCYTDIKKVKK
jgi:hypothetical protein